MLVWASGGVNRVQILHHKAFGMIVRQRACGIGFAENDGGLGGQRGHCQ